MKIIYFYAVLGGIKNMKYGKEVILHCFLRAILIRVKEKVQLRNRKCQEVFPETVNWTVPSRVVPQWL